ncbi:hypothetical protein GCM10017600_07830 [Streptosporangium carneum]|uniref:Integrase catalytic domain-containing protein n=1 Tax=Streptosporangium carneum TaxID=47481 RepID=A0A9W6MB78_9ACTN|nr:hypothetical protein GCM10017600_07830 [Streptosporangium carneum]
MRETRRSFDPEFRVGAVRIVREAGKSIASVARDLGMNASTLANWMQMDRLARERDADGELIESEREELARLRRQKAEWARGHVTHPHSAQALGGLVGQRGDGPVSVAAFIASQKTEHGVPHATACRILGVSQSWFYKWRDRAPGDRQRWREELDAAITAAFEDSGRTYGSPRITHDLREHGWQVSVNTVATRMSELGLMARIRRLPRSLTRQGKAPAAPELVHRQFNAVAADVLWCGDVTEILTDEGKLYLATVEDLFSRRLLGYAMSEHHDAALTVASLQMAAVMRGGNIDGVIFYTDRGSEGGFNRCSQHFVVGGVGELGLGKKQQAVRLYRGQIPSLGRLAVAWREDRVRFWRAIARGVSSEDAAMEIGVSPAVGTRWFRQAGGVGPCLAPTVSGRTQTRSVSRLTPRSRAIDVIVRSGLDSASATASALNSGG